VTDLVMRELHFGRIWRANVMRLVEASDDGTLVLWSPAGVTRKLPVDELSAEIRIPRPDFELGERHTVGDSLCLVQVDAPWSLWVFWDQGEFTHWYVNFEHHLARTERGLDYVDHKLDLIVTADGTVRWKDEEELEEAAALGLVDAASVRREAERVLAKPPWPTGWEGWRPDPSWPAPSFPDGWDALD
jgi:uncharacterized protein